MSKYSMRSWKARAMMPPFIMFAVVASAAYGIAAGVRMGEESISVYVDAGKYTVKRGVLDSAHAVAWATFEDSLNETGWGVLNIRTSALFTDVEQHHAAGIAEGVLTAHQIHPTYENNRAFTFHGKEPSEAVTNFMTEQEAWTNMMAADGIRNGSNFWKHVGAVQAQFDGLVEGMGWVLADFAKEGVFRLGFSL